VLVLCAIFLWVGWIDFKMLLPDADAGELSGWDFAHVLVGLLGLVIGPFLAWITSRTWRHGIKVAVTTDGLFVKLPEFPDELILWSDINGVSIKSGLGGKKQIVSMRLQGKWRPLDIGADYVVFPTQAAAERCVRQIEERISPPNSK
jgi:hypothetical protein